MTATWLRAPGGSWHCHQANGVSLCGLWEVEFATPPPDTIGRRWNHGDHVCRGCVSREKPLTREREMCEKGGVVAGLQAD